MKRIRTLFLSALVGCNDDTRPLDATVAVDVPDASLDVPDASVYWDAFPVFNVSHGDVGMDVTADLDH